MLSVLGNLYLMKNPEIKKQRQQFLKTNNYDKIFKKSSGSSGNSYA